MAERSTLENVPGTLVAQKSNFCCNLDELGYEFLTAVVKIHSGYSKRDPLLFTLVKHIKICAENYEFYIFFVNLTNIDDLLTVVRGVKVRQLTHCAGARLLP